MAKCEHKWKHLNSMGTYRENDGSFYCMPGYAWCENCGTLMKTSQDEPYELPSMVLLEHKGKSA